MFLYSCDVLSNIKHAVWKIRIVGKSYKSFLKDIWLCRSRLITITVLSYCIIIGYTTVHAYDTYHLRIIHCRSHYYYNTIMYILSIE